jgi:hypothetical protein
VEAGDGERVGFGFNEDTEGLEVRIVALVLKGIERGAVFRWEERNLVTRKWVEQSSAKRLLKKRLLHHVVAR